MCGSSLESRYTSKLKWSINIFKIFHYAETFVDFTERASSNESPAFRGFSLSDEWAWVIIGYYYVCACKLVHAIGCNEKESTLLQVASTATHAISQIWLSKRHGTGMVTYRLFPVNKWFRNEAICFMHLTSLAYGSILSTSDGKQMLVSELHSIVIWLSARAVIELEGTK